MKDGAADTIATARERERAAYAELGQIGREARAELVTLGHTGLDNLGRVLGQIGPTWDAESELLNPEPSCAERKALELSGEINAKPALRPGCEPEAAARGKGPTA
jgi:hypothetical protein